MQNITWSKRFKFSIARVRNYSQITNNVIEDTKEFIRAALYNGNEKDSYVNIIIVSPSFKSNDLSIAELNWINTFGKKRLVDKFYEGDNENKNVQVPENNN